MSLIPFSSRDRETQSVVLRHQQTLVLYDPKSHQLALRDLSPAPRAIETLPSCPYCHRPLHGDRNSAESSNISPNEQPGFVDPNYFRMLESSIRKTPNEQIPSHQHAPISPNRIRLYGGARVEDIDDRDGTEPIIEPAGSPSTHGISSSAFSPGYFQRFFVSEGELGRGGHAVVLLVRHILDGVDLGHFACKRVPVGNNHRWLEKILAEVQLLQRLSHMNLVSYRHVWLESVRITTFGPSVPCVFILQQYCNAGDLFYYVLRPTTTTKEDLKERLRRRSRGQPELPVNMNTYRRLPFEQILPFFRDIASGLSYLHLNGFIHRDLKPQNCLLSDTGVGPYPRVLLSDFGEVQMENTIRTSTGATGTISYCAPEVLERVEPGGVYRNFTTKSDVFSLGMTLYFMCFGRLPYEYSDQLHEENEDMDKLRAEICTWNGIVDKESLRSDLPDRLYKSLEKLLSPDPSKRPTADEILLGLNMGINEDIMPVRSQSPVKSASSGDEYQPLGFRRISAVADTPPPASPRGKSPRHRNGYSTFTEPIASSSSNQARPSKSSKLRGLTLDSEDSPSSLTPKISPDSSLILRPRPESQSLRISRSEFPLMLPPGTLRSRLLTIMTLPECILFAFKLFVFLGKVALITRPCSPLAANPWVYYPLLGLAALDFAFSSLQTTIILAVVHLMVLFLLGVLGTLCLY